MVEPDGMTDDFRGKATGVQTEAPHTRRREASISLQE